MPKMHSVASVAIEAIGYDAEEQTLYVRFVDGGEYRYFNIEESVFKNFMNAGSKGQYFNLEIKNVYECEQL